VTARPDVQMPDSTSDKDCDYPMPPDLVAEHLHRLMFGAPDEGEGAPWRQMLRLGGRTASRWATAVFLALRDPANDGDDELTEADKAFLAFIADQVVLDITAKLQGGNSPCKT